MTKKVASKEMEVTESTTKKSKPLPLIAKIAIGCVGILVLFGIILGVAGNVLFSKIGLNFMKKGFESKTGVTLDAEGKSMTIKDSKTGAEINVGEGKIPAGFPSDFPIYSGAKIEGNISGAENNAGKGFWLILSTSDASDKVITYYESNLPKNGWGIGETMNIADSSSMTVSKGSLTGSVIIGSDKEKGTSIIITLQPKEEAETNE